MAGGIVGAVVRDPLHDDVAWREYLEGVVRDRDGWDEFYDACRDLALSGPHLLGIRHHGPGSARSVRRALDAIRPDLVLVEAPADTEEALRWIGRPGLEPPVALLGYVVAQPERAVFAPLAVFSPEWQAVAWAAEHGVEVRAIDLPLAVSLAVTSASAAAARPPPTRWPRWPRPPASPTPSAGGRTSSSTAATASRCSVPSARRWPPSRAGTRARRRRGPT